MAADLWRRTGRFCRCYCFCCFCRRVVARNSLPPDSPRLWRAIDPPSAYTEEKSTSRNATGFRESLPLEPAKYVSLCPPPLRRSYSPSPVYFSLSLYPSPFLLYFLLSLLRLYLILLSGHGIFPSFFIFPVKPSLSFPRTFLGSSFLLAPLFAPIAHIPVRMHVCTRPLFDSRDITLSRGSFCDGGVYRGNALLSID